MKSTEIVKWTFVIGLTLGYTGGFARAQAPTETKISINCAKDIGKLDHFWFMSGFDHIPMKYDRYDGQ